MARFGVHIRRAKFGLACIARFACLEKRAVKAAAHPECLPGGKVRADTLGQSNLTDDGNRAANASVFFVTERLQAMPAAQRAVDKQTLKARGALFMRRIREAPHAECAQRFPVDIQKIECARSVFRRAGVHRAERPVKDSDSVDGGRAVAGRAERLIRTAENDALRETPRAEFRRAVGKRQAEKFLYKLGCLVIRRRCGQVEIGADHLKRRVVGIGLRMGSIGNRTEL